MKTSDESARERIRLLVQRAEEMLSFALQDLAWLASNQSRWIGQDIDVEPHNARNALREDLATSITPLLEKTSMSKYRRIFPCGCEKKYENIGDALKGYHYHRYGNRSDSADRIAPSSSSGVGQ
jgi:hypothetical protein